MGAQGDPSAAIAVVRAFLDAMEARDLEAARAYLATDFRMTFPGGSEFCTLEELIEWARPRYRKVAKLYQRFDVAPADEGETVYCFGTLEGEWPDGVPFSGIRFIDRFRVAHGRLAGQMVWNDLAEARSER